MVFGNSYRMQVWWSEFRHQFNYIVDLALIYLFYNTSSVELFIVDLVLIHFYNLFYHWFSYVIDLVQINDIPAQKKRNWLLGCQTNGTVLNMMIIHLLSVKLYHGFSTNNLLYTIHHELNYTVDLGLNMIIIHLLSVKLYHGFSTNNLLYTIHHELNYTVDLVLNMIIIHLLSVKLLWIK